MLFWAWRWSNDAESNCPGLVGARARRADYRVRGFASRLPVVSRAVWLESRSPVRALCIGLAVGLFGCRDSRVLPEPAPMCTGDAATELYTRKIEPILKDDRPTSCNQCHLSGIDLSLFVRDTPCQTMACLSQLGLVDLATPELSKVLSWIDRAKPQSTLITQSVIDAEYKGMLEWIQYSSSCGDQVCPAFDDPCNQNLPEASTHCDLALEVGKGYVDSGDCQELTLEQLFSADVYQWRERCFPCHFASDTSVQQAPKWITDVNLGNMEPGLACAASSLETMRSVLSRGYVNLEQPAQSLILLKPLSTEGGGVTHGGGPKFDGPADPSYQSFLGWITRYSACTAEDPSLPLAGPPPAIVPSTPPTEMPGSTMPGATTSIYDYCNCMLFSCHDASHAKWGETDEQLLAGCRAEAIDVPIHGAATTMGNFLECRAAYCAQARDNTDACSAAFGDTVCR
jgi:hypothetical protein